MKKKVWGLVLVGICLVVFGAGIWIGRVTISQNDRPLTFVGCYSKGEDSFNIAQDLNGKYTYYYIRQQEGGVLRDSGSLEVKQDHIAVLTSGKYAKYLLVRDKESLSLISPENEIKVFPFTLDTPVEDIEQEQ